MLNLKPFTYNKQQKFAKFLLKISSRYDLIDQKRQAYPLKPGFETILRIIPKVISTSQEFRALAIDERKCKLSHETEGFQFLQMYSQAGCEFECAAKYAVKICKCLPWYYTNNFTKIPMCDMFGARCFNNIMSNKDHYEECPESCLESCEQVTFTILPSFLPLETEELCKKDKNIEKLFFDARRKTIFTKNFETYYKPYKGNPSFETCSQYLKQFISFVSVETPSKYVTRSRRERKYTFEEKLATIGGTLGLFSGMSILSMVEILFCILSVCRALVKVNE